jgi:hypothetical protein
VSDATILGHGAHQLVSSIAFSTADRRKVAIWERSQQPMIDCSS